MIWTSNEIKKQGLTNLTGHFIQAFLAVFLLRLIMDIPILFFSQDIEIDTLPLNVSLPLLVLFICGATFFVSVLDVGKNTFYLSLSTGNSSLRMLWKYFSMGIPTYISVVKGMFLRHFSICVGTLLFLIPGIIQYYHSFFVPWILADTPATTPLNALQKSKAMTTGQKINLFIMQITFVGWIILSYLLAQRLRLLFPVSLGSAISSAIYALPFTYYHASVAELYGRLKTS